MISNVSMDFKESNGKNFNAMAWLSGEWRMASGE
jgi:hypothetical protein